MKKLPLLLCTIALCSCASSTYMQVVDVKSSLPTVNDNYVYTDEACRITYALWSKGGDPGFYVENLTDEILYLDLTKTFFIENGTAYDYFQNRTHEDGTTRSSSNTTAATAFSLLVGTPVTLASSNSKTTSSNMTTSEKPIIAIPPHAGKSVSEFTLAADVMQDCSIRLFPKSKKPESITFTQENSPLHFSNYITYRVGDSQKEKVVQNDFHVAGFTNYVSTEIEEKVKTGCKSQLKQKVNKQARNTRFYLPYDHMHKKDFSADASEPYGTVH